ncbi:MAG: hypothetical protein Q9M50_02475 [Methylococcales bacterium]|nr:hypothetical protein [Methylococcales bacterium]
MTHLIFTFSEKQAKKSSKASNKEPMMYALPKAEIEREARVGESWEDAAFRIKAEKLK